MTAEAAATAVGIVACRGCCCGTDAKVPGADHEAQLDRLRDFADRNPGTATVRPSPCLGPCEYANVVVARPSRLGRSRGGRPVWLGLVDDYALELVQEWARAGGPGIAELPDALQLHQISRPRAGTPAAPAG